MASIKNCEVMMGRRFSYTVSVVLIAIIVISASLLVLLRPDGKRFSLLPVFLGTLAFILFSLSHATYLLGLRHALIFFLLSAGVSWAFEHIDTATGFLSGPYHYTLSLGVKLGRVPILIPMAWFMMLYPSFIIANLISDDHPNGGKGGFGRIAWLSFLGAYVMTAWDVVMDPQMSGSNATFAENLWIWDNGGGFFGVPFRNFLGWMLVTFMVNLLYRLFERRVPASPLGPVTRGVTVMPLLAYAAMMICLTRFARPVELRLIGIFVMGLPLAAAFARLYTNQRSS